MSSPSNSLETSESRIPDPGSRVIHLIGICGTAMATLAALLKRRGYDVRGSDQNVYPPMSDFLAAEDIPIVTGYAADHVGSDVDLVVVGNAISRGNAELESILERKIRYCSLPEAVRDHFLWGSRSIVVAGTHGKTTTTSLTGWLLTHGRLDPTVLVGGIALNFGDGGSSYRVGRGRDFVIEGDEYDSAFFDKTAKFLKYLPDVAVINNVEFDHADIYADFDAVTLAFRRLVTLVPRRGLLLIGADSPGARALAVGADEQQPVLRDEIDQSAKRQRDGVEVRVDVRVIELDVVDDGDVRQVLQELRRLVEEGAVVFITFDDEVAPVADAVT